MPDLSSEATHRSVRGLGHDFNLLATGQGLSWFGSAFQPIALTTALVIRDGAAHSVGPLGVLMALMVASQMVWTLVGGVSADRFEARKVMIVADLARMLAAGGMAAAFATGHRGMLLLAVLMVVMGTGTAFFGPAMRAVKPIVVTPEQRKSANSALSALQTGAQMMVGPALAGVLVASFGAPFGFAVNAATFLVSAVAVAGIRVRVQQEPAQGVLHDLMGGLRAMREQDWLVWGVSSAALMHLAVGALFVLVQVATYERLGGAHALGLVAAAQGVGGFAGSLVAMRFHPRRPLVVGYLVILGLPLWVASYVWPTELLVVMALAVVGFFGMVFFNVQWETAIQDNVPQSFMARVSSWDILTSFIGMPIGEVLAGPMSSALGLNTSLLTGAVVLVVSLLFPLLAHGTRSLSSDRRINLAGSAPAQADADAA